MPSAYIVFQIQAVHDQEALSQYRKQAVPANPATRLGWLRSIGHVIEYWPQRTPG